jgi:hypothetical protein
MQYQLKLTLKGTEERGRARYEAESDTTPRYPDLQLHFNFHAFVVLRVWREQ